MSAAGVADTLQSVAKRAMVMRSVRVNLAKWEKGKAKADRNDETISDVFRRWLDQYIDEDEDQE